MNTSLKSPNWPTSIPNCTELAGWGACLKGKVHSFHGSNHHRSFQVQHDHFLMLLRFKDCFSFYIL